MFALPSSWAQLHSHTLTPPFWCCADRGFFSTFLNIPELLLGGSSLCPGWDGRGWMSLSCCWVSPQGGIAVTWHGEVTLQGRSIPFGH